MAQRLRSGHHRLDRILGGGLWTDSLTLLTGAPGTGKTLLAQQFVFANASPERPALYVSTVSEPMEKILRYGRSLSFFDDEAVGRWVFYEDLGSLLEREHLPLEALRLVGRWAEVHHLGARDRPGHGLSVPTTATIFHNHGPEAPWPEARERPGRKSSATAASPLVSVVALVVMPLM